MPDRLPPDPDRPHPPACPPPRRPPTAARAQRSTYELIADLPLVIDGYGLEGLSRRVSTGFRRFTTVIQLSGNGHQGAGEDVTYEAADQRRQQRLGPVLPLAGTWTIDSFSRRLAGLDTFPAGAPTQPVSRSYRRWALESAALDLALRQAGRPLHETLGLAPHPLTFVISLNLGPAPSCAPIARRLATHPDLRFKLDATSAWDDALIGCLIDRRAVDCIDFKGAYDGALSAVAPDPALYRRVAETFPHAWLEDPDLTDPAAREWLYPHRERVTWDAPIHSVADIAGRPWPPRTVNLKPSRFGSLRALFDAYDHCAEHRIGVYGGGQYELGPGRQQIQYLAALFHPDGPNDIAPTGYDDADPALDLPRSPMTVDPGPAGFRLRA